MELTETYSVAFKEESEVVDILFDEVEITSDSLDVNSQLQKMLQEYFEQYKFVSLNSISQRSGVAFTTLCRIWKLQQKSSVSPHVVLQLVAFLKKEYRVAFLLQKINGPIAELLNAHFGKFVF